MWKLWPGVQGGIQNSSDSALVLLGQSYYLQSGRRAQSNDSSSPIYSKALYPSPTESATVVTGALRGRSFCSSSSREWGDAALGTPVALSAGFSVSWGSGVLAVKGSWDTPVFLYPMGWNPSEGVPLEIKLFWWQGDAGKTPPVLFCVVILVLKTRAHKQKALEGVCCYFIVMQSFLKAIFVGLLFIAYWFCGGGMTVEFLSFLIQ